MRGYLISNDCSKGAHLAALGRFCSLGGAGKSDTVKFGNFDRNGGFQAENRSLIGQKQA